MTIQAPYRFVPLAKSVVFPEWADQVSHDKPFADGICGELDITLTTHSQTCVGGEQTRENNQAGKVHFYRTAENKPAIPASSLKGMLRNVLEIATFSRFKQVEDQKLGVRDIRNAGNFYQSRISDPEAGWLRFEDGQWLIYPCEFARIHQKDVIQSNNITYKAWANNNRKTLKQRYDLLGICPKIKFKLSGKNKVGQDKAVPSNEKNALDGRIVVTGQPGQFYYQDKPNLPKPAKKYEFVFYDEFEPVALSAKVFAGFQQIYANTEEWIYLKKHAGQQGIPVFFHSETNNPDNVISLGLSMMYKLPYDNSIHDAIGNTNSLHTANIANYDFADLLFGCIADDEQSLKGRIHISMAHVVGMPQLKWTQSTVLNAPKPNYYPTYILQTGKGNGFSQLMDKNVQLAGWKRYPVRNENVTPPPEGAGTSVQVSLETVAANQKFNSKIRFHNLRPIELGALLWVLDFGGRNHLRHNIGTGKPFGLGQISIQINQSDLVANNRAQQVCSLDDCREAFIAYMNAQFQNNNYEKLSEIETLLTYAEPNKIAHLDYMPLKDFSSYKDKRNVTKFADMFHNKIGSTTTGSTAKIKPIQPTAPVKIATENNAATANRVSAQSITREEVSENNAVIQAKIDAVIAKKSKNSSETDEIFLLAELEGNNSSFDSTEKPAVAQYLKTRYQQQKRWREISSSNKAERKLFEQTNRIKRFLNQ